MVCCGAQAIDSSPVSMSSLSSTPLAFRDTTTPSPGYPPLSASPQPAAADRFSMLPPYRSELFSRGLSVQLRRSSLLQSPPLTRRPTMTPQCMALTPAGFPQTPDTDSLLAHLDKDVAQLKRRLADRSSDAEGAHSIASAAVPPGSTVPLDSKSSEGCSLARLPLLDSLSPLGQQHQLQRSCHDTTKIGMDVPSSLSHQSRDPTFASFSLASTPTMDTTLALPGLPSKQHKDSSVSASALTGDSTAMLAGPSSSLAQMLTASPVLPQSLIAAATAPLGISSSSSGQSKGVSPTFSGSPVAELRHAAPRIPVRLTKKEKVSCSCTCMTV